jgi:hypothetical protein
MHWAIHSSKCSRVCKGIRGDVDGLRVMSIDVSPSRIIVSVICMAFFPRRIHQISTYSTLDYPVVVITPVTRHNRLCVKGVLSHSPREILVTLGELPPFTPLPSPSSLHALTRTSPPPRAFLTNPSKKVEVARRGKGKRPGRCCQKWVGRPFRSEEESWSHYYYYCLSSSCRKRQVF